MFLEVTSHLEKWLIFQAKISGCFGPMWIKGMSSQWTTQRHHISVIWANTFCTWTDYNWPKIETLSKGFSCLNMRVQFHFRYLSLPSLASSCFSKRAQVSCRSCVMYASLTQLFPLCIASQVRRYPHLCYWYPFPCHKSFKNLNKKMYPHLKLYY